MLLTAMAIVVAVLLTACGGQSAETEPAAQPQNLPVEARPGALAPDFTLQALDGGTVKLSDFRGKVVLLNLWSFCTPCKVEKPIIQEAYSKYKDQGFEVVAVEMGHSAEEVKQFIAGMGLTFTIVLNPDASLARRYRVRGEPTTFFIDRQGVIRAVHPGPLTLQAIEGQLNSLL